MTPFAYFYEFCALVFILQGVSIPVVLGVSGALWHRQGRRLDMLRSQLTVAPDADLGAGERLEQVLRALPKLRPLNCTSCGAGVLLRDTDTLCPSCGTRDAMPEDYAATTALRRETRGLLKSAVRHWRVANVLTYPLVSGLFLVLAFVEPLVLFPAVVIGGELFPESRVDRALEGIGPEASFVLVAPALLGFIVWMILFLFLRGLSKGLRVKLPLVPVLAGEAQGRETASCQACGGSLAYDAGAFAALCDYCHVENFRVRFVRRRRAQAEQERTQTHSTLFGALEIIEEMNGTFFLTASILLGACVLLTGYYALNALL